MINGQHRITAALKLKEKHPETVWDKKWFCAIYNEITPFQEGQIIGLNNAADSMKNSIALSCSVLRNVVYSKTPQEYEAFRAADAFQLVFTDVKVFTNSQVQQANIFKQIAVFPKYIPFVHPGLTVENAEPLEERDLTGTPLKGPI